MRQIDYWLGGRRVAMVFGCSLWVLLAFFARAEACDLGAATTVCAVSADPLYDFQAKNPAGCDPDFGPSGIVYHPGRDRLVVVSDEGGQYATIKTDGTDVECWNVTDAMGQRLSTADYEGVTYADPGDGFIYIALEYGGVSGMAFIHQVDMNAAKLVNIWKIEFPGGIANRSDGLEGITFVRDAGHPEGGTFYIGDQTADKVIGKCELPIKSGGDTNNVYTCTIAMTPPQFKEVSGLDYAADAQIGGQTGVVFVSSDKKNKIRAYAPDGTDLGWERELPNSSAHLGQEGHALKDCDLFISSDANSSSQKIYHYRFQDHPCP